jgi:tRNA/rRNA methyltransferase
MVADLERVRIVLVQPAGSRNVGMIARVMKNFGLCQLMLVQPQCQHLDEEARHMAVHAADVLEAAQVVSSLVEALQGCQRAIATTARARALTPDLETPRAALPWLLETVSELTTSALVFGPEDRGLSNDELSHAQRFVSIPSSSSYPVLNLAQAVAVCCYELYQCQLDQTEGSLPAQPISQPGLTLPAASIEQIEGFYQQFEAILLRIGYLYPHTADSRMQKFRRLFGRSSLSVEEVAMLRGILSQINWAIENLQK